MRYLFQIIAGIAAASAAIVPRSWNSDTTSHFLTNNPLPNGFPWGEKTCYNSNSHVDAPVTGVTRYYNFTVSRDIVNIDGFGKLYSHP